MTDLAALDAYGVLTEPATLTIQRLLPGPIERCWAYLTESDLRRRWLASGDMEMKVGAPVELVWRHDEITDPAGERPAGFDAEHRMKSRITVLEAPRKLGITWGEKGEVIFDLTPQGDQVLLTVTHLRLPDRSVALNASAGWHTHLDVLVARLADRKPGAYWDEWRRVRAEYERRMSA